MSGARGGLERIEGKLSVVIPAFNEEQRLGGSLERIATFLTERGLDHEIIVVDDGSRDRTAEVAGAFATRGVRLLGLEHNTGKGAAVRRGVLASAGSLVLICDADLSTPIEDLEVLAAFLDRAEVVVGSRALPESNLLLPQPWPRRVMGRMFNGLVQALGVRGIRDTQCGFKLLEGTAARRLLGGLSSTGFAYDVELLWLARRERLRIAEAPVTWRDSGPSKVRPWIDPLLMAWEVARIRWSHRRDPPPPRASALPG
jgi:dolichyl-phosphate beta-glucosyltransferase